MAKHKNKGEKKEKPSWTDIAGLVINFGLFVVALLALLFK